MSLVMYFLYGLNVLSDLSGDLMLTHVISMTGLSKMQSYRHEGDLCVLIALHLHGPQQGFVISNSHYPVIRVSLQNILARFTG